jgi:hypothetical protein
MGHTYGTWLPGDPKGFRTRHHREHIEGDYKKPPAMIRMMYDTTIQSKQRGNSAAIPG